MTLSISTLSAIQKAGSAVFAADAKLKNAIKEYGERVNAAIASNPYNLGNDALFANWKIVARLSQTLAGIEEELKKVYSAATELNAAEQAGVPQGLLLAAPPRSAHQLELAPTDVEIKSRKKTAPAKAKLSSAKVAAAAVRTGPLSGNPARLLQHLERVLNSDQFTEISQTAVGREIGIPMGSMTAATKKLMKIGRIVAGPNGSFKLTDSQQAVAA